MSRAVVLAACATLASVTLWSVCPREVPPPPTVTPDAVVAVVQRADSVAQAHTDTVIQRVLVTRWRVDTVVQRVPDTLKVVPEVAELMQVAQTLAAQVDTLDRALTAERATGVLARQVAAAQLTEARVVIRAQAQEVTQLQKRPTRAKAALWTVGGAVVGLVVGVMR